MTIAITPAPVRRRFSLKAPPERAFEVFVAGIGRWWPRSHQTGSSPLVDVVIERQVGGRWFGKGADGSEENWGKVLVWEPPHRLVLAWQLSAAWQFDPDLVTEVELVFDGQPDGTTEVRFEHRNLERYGEAAEIVRGAIASDNGWPLILDAYAALVA